MHEIQTQGYEPTSFAPQPVSRESISLLHPKQPMADTLQLILTCCRNYKITAQRLLIVYDSANNRIHY